MCGKQAKVVQGSCECSQSRDDIIKLLKALRIDKPESFMGIFQQEHKACIHCTKYIYGHLKKEKAKRSLTRPDFALPSGCTPAKPGHSKALEMTETTRKHGTTSQETTKNKPWRKWNESEEESEETGTRSTCIELDAELSKLNTSKSADELVSARWLDQSLNIVDCKDSAPERHSREVIENSAAPRTANKVYPSQPPGKLFDQKSSKRSQRQQGSDASWKANLPPPPPPPQWSNKGAPMMGGPMQQMGGPSNGWNNPMMGGPQLMTEGPGGQQMMWMMMMAGRQQ